MARSYEFHFKSAKMAIMKRIIKIFTTIMVLTLIGISLGTPIQAVTTYTTEEVSQYNTETDCWMIYDGGVYDLTNYLNQHDKYMDITSWCGTDMTEAFETKDGSGQDHRSSTYALLENYKIGEINDTSTSSTSTGDSSENTTVIGPGDSSLLADNTESNSLENNSLTSNDLSSTEDDQNVDTTSETVKENPYNFRIPFLATIVIYIISYVIMKKAKNFAKAKQKFNLIWNTMLIISLIPSFIFGIYLMMRYSFPSLADVNFDFLYWHVEGSVVFGTLVCLHLLFRLTQYKLQYKSMQ